MRSVQPDDSRSNDHPAAVASAVTVLETQRLVLRHLSLSDAEFILELLNQPSFIRYIGDRGVRTVDDARRYILEGPVASYERHGFGLYLVQLKESGVRVGICGLVKRETLPDVDIGFAFLPQYGSRGYAFESASATMVHGREVLGLKRIVAITTSDNDRSIRLLERIGLRFSGMIRLASDAEELRLFVSDD